MALTPPVAQALPGKALLGEGVLWDHQRQVVWFVDIKRHELWQFDPASGRSVSYAAPGQIGWAIPAENDLLLCGLQDGLHTFDPATGDFTFLMTVPGEPAHNRLNDACTDPWGRVWFGSMDDAEEAASGRFHIFDRGDIAPAGPSGITITNGPAVNADGTRIYFTDTLARRIMVADLSCTALGEVRMFADTAVGFPDAYPDGPIVDAEGFVWTGLYLGGRVARYSPDGALVAQITMPARDITKLALGGSDFSTGFVTTATKNMAVEDMQKWPNAGSLFAFKAPVRGFAQTLAKLS